MTPCSHSPLCPQPGPCLPDSLRNDRPDLSVLPERTSVSADPGDIAFAERGLRTLSDLLGELGVGLNGLAGAHEATARATRKAATGDDYGNTFWSQQGQRFERAARLLRLIAEQSQTAAGNTVQTRRNYQAADDASTLRDRF